MLVRAGETRRARTFLQNPGVVASLALGLVLVAFALSIDFPKAAYGFQSDESTYYSLGHSIAKDFDFAFTREDLTECGRNFRRGPKASS